MKTVFVATLLLVALTIANRPVAVAAKIEHCDDSSNICDDNTPESQLLHDRDTKTKTGQGQLHVNTSCCVIDHSAIMHMYIHICLYKHTKLVADPGVSALSMNVVNFYQVCGWNAICIYEGWRATD